MADQDERRRAPRVKSINLVNVDRFDPDGIHADLAVGRTLDLSKLGLRLELNHPLPLRSLIDLSLALGDDVVNIEGRVIFAKELASDRYAMGLEFVEMDEATQTKLERFVDEHRES